MEWNEDSYTADKYEANFDGFTEYYEKVRSWAVFFKKQTTFFWRKNKTQIVNSTSKNSRKNKKQD